MGEQRGHTLAHTRGHSTHNMRKRWGPISEYSTNALFLALLQAPTNEHAAGAKQDGTHVAQWCTADGGATLTAAPVAVHPPAPTTPAHCHKHPCKHSSVVSLCMGETAMWQVCPTYTTLSLCKPDSRR